jgi:ABC-type glycerol-3-phosphate transport system substrate-binding protein
MISCKSDEQTLEYKKEIATIQDEQTELKWLGQWFGEGKKEDLVREMARDFSFLNQDVNLELQFAFEMAKIDSFADPFRSVADSIISWIQNDRWPFDIFVCDKWFYAEIAGLINDEDWGPKHLLDFKDEDWFIESHKDYVLNSNEYVGSFGGIAPGAFIEGAWDLLYVSSEVENKLGIKVKDYNMSIDDFIEYAKIVHQHNQTNDEKITLCATNYQAITQVLNQVIMSEIGNTDYASATEQISALNKVYKKLEELAKYKPTEQYHEYSSDRELKHDKTLFHLHSTWVTLFWQRSNPEGEKLMRPCEFPSMPDKAAHSYSGTYNAIFAIPKNAKNRDDAVRLMQYMSSVDIAEKWENYSKCPTGLNSRMSFSEFGNDDFSNFSKHMSEKYDNRLADFSLANDLFNGRQAHVNFHAMDVAEGRMTASQAVSRIRSQLR